MSGKVNPKRFARGDDGKLHEKLIFARLPVRGKGPPVVKADQGLGGEGGGGVSQNPLQVPTSPHEDTRTEVLLPGDLTKAPLFRATMEMIRVEARQAQGGGRREGPPAMRRMAAAGAGQGCRREASVNEEVGPLREECGLRGRRGATEFQQVVDRSHPI